MKSENTPTNYVQTALDLAQRYEAKRIFPAFAAAGVQVIGLKGIVLKDDLYESSERRPMYDIDVLVHYEDIERAEKVLRELGYTFLSDGDYNLEFTRKFMGEIPYKKGGVIVELHWHLVSMTWNRRATQIDLGALWQRAQTIDLLGVPALRLSLEDEIVYLCYHLAVPHSLWHQSSISDLYRLIQKNAEDIKWPLVVWRAKEWHIRVAGWAALRSLQMRTDINIPVQTMAAFEVPNWRQRLIERMIPSGEKRGSVLVSDHKRFLGILLVDNFANLPGVLISGMLPGRQWLKSRYNLTNRASYLRQLTYPFEVVMQAVKAIISI